MTRVLSLIFCLFGVGLLVLYLLSRVNFTVHVEMFGVQDLSEVRSSLRCLKMLFIMPIAPPWTRYPGTVPSKLLIPSLEFISLMIWSISHLRPLSRRDQRPAQIPPLNPKGTSLGVVSGQSGSRKGGLLLPGSIIVSTHITAITTLTSTWLGFFTIVGRSRLLYHTCTMYVPQDMYWLLFILVVYHLPKHSLKIMHHARVKCRLITDHPFAVDSGFVGVLGQIM